jgi:hypothetical protein
VANNRIVANGYADATGTFVPLLRVSDYPLGQSFPDFTANPGFNALANNGLPGSGQNIQGQGQNTGTLLFDVLSDLQYWNGTGPVSFGPVPSGETMAWHLGPSNGGSNLTIGTGIGFQNGFSLGTLAIDGSLHKHVGATLQAGNGNPSPTNGIYLLPIWLRTLDTNPAFAVGNSQPMWFIYNENLDTSGSGPEAQAVTWVKTNLAREPAKWTGGATDGNWSSPSNWDSAPVDYMDLTFAGTTHTTTTNDALTTVGLVSFDSTAAPFTVGGNALSIGGGITNNSTSTQTINLNLTLAGSQQFNAASGNLVLGGTINTGTNALTTLMISGSSNTTLAGAISGSGRLSVNTSGTTTVSGNNSYSGGTFAFAGTLAVAHVHGLGTGGLTINNSAKVQLQAGLSAPVQLPSLTIAGGATPTATLDVTNNNVVVHNGDLATTLAQLRSGLNSSGALWAGAGVTSSTAAADAAAHSNATVFAAGAIQNIDKNGNLIYSTWPAPPSPDTGATGLATTDVLVKYTYFGDADLNGVVDNTTDYDLWSNGFTNPGLAATNGWLYGDFDYSGIVDNTTDYDLWSTGFAHQGGALASGASAVLETVQPVPEPASVTLVILAIAGQLSVSTLRFRRITDVLCFPSFHCSTTL